MKTFILVAVIICILTGCNKLENGTVVEMWYEPPTQYLYLMPISTGKLTILMPMYIYDNEDYCINVTGVIGDDTIMEKYYITKSKYDSLRLGDFVCVKGDCNEDFNNQKVKVNK